MFLLSSSVLGEEAVQQLLLDYLQLARGLSLSSSKLGHLSFYEEIEDTFREVAAEFGHSVGCVDLATWLTMRVAKKEAFI